MKRRNLLKFLPLSLLPVRAGRAATTEAAGIWIACKVIDYDRATWQICNVFDDIDKAKGACVTDDHFVLISFLNKPFWDAPDPCEKIWFPMAENKPLSWSSIKSGSISI